MAAHITWAYQAAKLCNCAYLCLHASVTGQSCEVIQAYSARRVRAKTLVDLLNLLWNVFAGHEIGDESVAIYKESLGDLPLLYHSKHGKLEEGGPLGGTPIMAPYAPLQALQQKRLSARRHKTTYCYDFTSVFGTALRDIWTSRALTGEPGIMPQGNPTYSNDLQFAWCIFNCPRDLQAVFTRALKMYSARAS